MPRSLLITIRFHEGRYHGQEDRFNGSDGWPPSPGRLFQALVAGAARGARASCGGRAVAEMAGTARSAEDCGAGGAARTGGQAVRSEQ